MNPASEGPVASSDAELKQRLAAIMMADAVGYSRLMNKDERATVTALDTARAIFRRQIETNQGRVIDMAGDSVLAIFETAIGAVNAAIAIQQTIAVASSELLADRRMSFRIGVHLGDVFEKADGTIYGDGVNIAARLQGLAPPGGIMVSDAVRGVVQRKIAAAFIDRGNQSVKNIAHPVRAFSVHAGGSSLAFSKMAVSRVVALIASRKWTLLTIAVVLASLAMGGLLLSGNSRYSEFLQQAKSFFGFRVSGGLDAPFPAAAMRRLSIVVLPFANISGDHEQDYFADGITEDVTSDISRIPGLFVIGRSTAFNYKGMATDVGKIGRELGVRYVLQGTVRRLTDKVRVNAQLVSTRVRRAALGRSIRRRNNPAVGIAGPHYFAPRALA